MLLNFLSNINAVIWNHVILWFLLLAGGYFTLSLRFVQIRLFSTAIHALLKRKAKNKTHVSSFQALCTSLAQRVGTGNLAGVATALTFGGEGAVFWMWVTALLGSATAFAECTLAQVYKVKNADGSFFGGPAYYIRAGLRSKTLAIIFSLSLVMAMGFVFNAVQSNTIAQGLLTGFAIDPLITSLILCFGTALIIFGGRKRVARTAEILVPFMALSYLLLTFYIVLTHITEVPHMLQRILSAAFTIKAVGGGVLGHGIWESLRHGVARGLFSNEAGWGSAPNAAASADVDHPVQQGLVQMIAVFIDTLLICTSTALLILFARDLPTNQTGIALTQAAALFHFGTFGKLFIGLAIFLFGFTTILGNSFYGEANIQFIFGKPIAVQIYRVLVLIMVAIGALLEVPLVWEMADIMSAIMAVINLSSIILLTAVVKKTLSHFSIKFLNEGQMFSFDQIRLVHSSEYDFAYDIRHKEE